MRARLGRLLCRWGFHRWGAPFVAVREMWETATHVARFEDRAMAEAIALRVPAASRAHKEAVSNPLAAINKDWWQGPTSEASPVRWNAKHEPFRVGA